MQLRRPKLFFLQCRERPAFRLEDLLDGGSGVVQHDEWLALAPHLGREVVLEHGDVDVFSAVTPSQPRSQAKLASRFGADRIDRLVAAGLLIGDHPDHQGLRERESALADVDWWGPAALAQVFGRWHDVDVATDPPRLDGDRWQELVAEQGAPPPETIELLPPSSWQSLPAPPTTALDRLLQARSTCRNFGPDALPLADLATVLHRVFGAQAVQTLAPQAVALKKNSPSGGGLHPVEAYVLAQRVEGLAPGLYHYLCVAHALEPLQLIAADAIAPLARELVAGQAWFADAPVLVLMAARFQRNFWKYRRHAKAWRVIQLDAGHLSQTFQLAATDLGLGAFVTAAINDAGAERLFKIDGLSTGAIAVCGLGRRAADLNVVEFDPLGKAVR